MKTIHDLLKELKACRYAQKWAKKYSTPEEMLENCHRDDYLFWMARKMNVPDHIRADVLYVRSKRIAKNRKEASEICKELIGERLLQLTKDKLNEPKKSI